VPQRLGSSTVAFSLLKTFEEIDQKNEYEIFFPSAPLSDLPKERPGWKYRVLKPKRLWTRIALPLELYRRKDKPDIFFSPTHYIPRFSSVKTVATIFDLSFLHFPEMFQKKDLWQLKSGTKYSIDNAESIVTISEFSKKDIVGQYRIDPKKITVAYPGKNEVYMPVNDQSAIKKTQNKYKTGDSYIIYIGTIQPRKNLKRLIEAFKDVEEAKLVIVGKTIGEGREGWMYEDILDYPKKLGIDDKVLFTGFVNDQDLVLLVNGAKAFIQPSLWEGFGMPVVDAMSCGTPVLVSSASCLPEVVGKAGLTFDPYSVTEIEDKINQILSDNKLREELSRKGLERAREFSWKIMAKKVIDVMEGVGR
jgi:glycosyltransferase involved in cell wall biosynthesis